VLAGEDRNDREVLRGVIEATCPRARGRVVEISDSVRLKRAGPETLAQRVRTLVGKARARAAREQAEIGCLFVHEDLDATGAAAVADAHGDVQKALRCHVDKAYYVLAAWEVEAWLLLFPEALTAVCADWKVPDKYRGIDTGYTPDPKRLLRTLTGKATRRYRESDAPKVMAKAAQRSLLDSPNGRNSSWERFRSDAAACCGAFPSRQ
jgi:hypothetical protein